MLAFLIDNQEETKDDLEDCLKWFEDHFGGEIYWSEEYEIY